MSTTNNHLVIAAAGSGKTTYLIRESLRNPNNRILITTYPQANEEEIRRKFIKINGCIPSNVVVQTWFSFLLQHGIRPYQGCRFKENIKGLVLINGQSAKGIPENNVAKHYFTDRLKIYSDKLSKFAIKCNEESDGRVIKRLSKIYTDIFIDEVQDLAGYDLEFLKLLFESDINIILVGDPRQGTYSTNNSAKNKKYKKANIVSFFEDDSISIETDDTSLTTNYRSVAGICDLSNKLYPGFQKTHSGYEQTSEHDGIFLVRPQDIDSYLEKYKPIQLRDSIKTKVNNNYNVLTFGKAKGLEFNRVLIYPTRPFLEWMMDNSKYLATTSRAKLYVGITRASHSVAIVYNYSDDISIDGLQKFI